MPRILPNILGIIENWGRWSEIIAVKLPDIMSGSVTSEKNIIYKSSCKIKEINELGKRI